MAIIDHVAHMGTDLPVATETQPSAISLLLPSQSQP
jgi:hypothetical protein